MSSYPKPPREYAIFDPTIFNVSRYLEYPVAQGAQTLQAITVKGLAIFQAFANFQGILVNGLATFSSYVLFNGEATFNTQSIFNSFIRIRDGGNQSTIDQSNNELIMENETISGTINLKTHNGSGTATTPLQISSTSSTFSNDVNFNNKIYIKDGSNQTTIDQIDSDLKITNETTSGTISIWAFDNDGFLQLPLQISGNSSDFNSNANFNIDAIFNNNIYVKDGTNNTLIDQSTTNLNIENQVISGTINLKTKNSAGTATTPISITSPLITVNSPTDFIDVINSKNSINIYDSSNLSNYSIIDQISSDLVINNNVNSGYTTFTNKNATGDLKTPFKVSSASCNITSPVTINTTGITGASTLFTIKDTTTTNELYTFISSGLGNWNPMNRLNNISIIGGGVVDTKTLFLGVHSNTTSGLRLQYNNVVLGCGGTGNEPSLYFQCYGPDNKNYVRGATRFANNVEIGGSLSMENDLDMNSKNINELEQISFTSSFDAVGPNKIKLYGSEYGFGVDTNTLKYLSYRNHSFYYNSSSTSNGTEKFRITNTLSSFFTDLEIKNKYLYLYDVSNDNDKYSKINQEGVYFVIRNETTSGQLAFQAKDSLGTQDNRLIINSSTSYFYTDITFPVTTTPSSRKIYFTGETDTAFIKFVTTGIPGSDSTYFEIGTQDNGTEPIYFTQSSYSRMKIASDGIYINKSDTGFSTTTDYNLKINNGKLVFTDALYSDEPNKIVLFNDGTGPYGFGIGTDYKFAYCAGGGTSGNHRFYIGATSTSNGTEKFRIANTLSSFYNRLNVTTSYGNSLNASYTIDDTLTTNVMDFYISLPSGNYNPFNPTNSSAIIARGVINTNTLFLGAHSSTSSGIRVSHNQVTMGAGGTGSVPSLYFQSYGPDNRNYIVGDTDLTGGLTFKNTGTIKTTTMNTASTGNFIIEANGTDAVIYFYTNTSSQQINSMTVKPTQVELGVDLKLFNKYLYLYDINNDNTKYTTIDQEGNYFVIRNEATSGQIAFFIKDSAGTSANRLNITSTDAYCSVNLNITDHLFFRSSTTYSYVGQETSHLVFRNTANAGGIYLRTKTTTGGDRETVVSQNGLYISGGSLSIYESSSTSFTGLGINNPYNSNGRVSFSGIGGQTFTDVNQFSATSRVRFLIGDIGPTLRADTTIIKFRVTFTFYNDTNYGQTRFNIDFFPYRWTQGSKGINQLYNVNNKINGNAAFVYTNATYAPNGRQFYTSDQTFTGITGENGCFYAENDYWTLYFALPNNTYTWSGCVEALDTTDATTWTESVKLVVI